MCIKVVVREAASRDAGTLARLNADFNGGSQDASQLAQRLADPRRVETPILAEVDGRAAGFASLRVVPCVFYPEPHAELTELYVDPAYRQQGVGRALVAFAEQLARKAGAVEIVLLTGFDNAPAQALYRALGYRDLDLGMFKRLD